MKWKESVWPRISWPRFHTHTHTHTHRNMHFILATKLDMSTSEHNHCCVDSVRQTFLWRKLKKLSLSLGTQVQNTWIHISVLRLFFYCSNSQHILHEGKQKIFFLSQVTPNYEEIYRPGKWGVYGGAQRLLKYCQLPDKNSRYISWDIWNFYAVINPYLTIVENMVSS